MNVEIMMCDVTCPMCNAPISSESHLTQGLKQNRIAALGARLAQLQSSPGNSDLKKLQLQEIHQDLSALGATVDADGFVVSR